MARQGSILHNPPMLLSVNTELHSSASSPDPNVHMLSPEKPSRPPTSCQSCAPVMLQQAEVKNVTRRVTSDRLLFQTNQTNST